MSKLYGYGGTILRIDLTTGEIRKEPTPEKLCREYLGGRGFVAKLEWDEVAPGTDPLSPGNKVIMAPGPLSGVLLPGSGKCEFGAKSPQTGGYGDSNVGGHLAPEVKYAGYDAVIIGGAAAKPTVIVIDDDKVTLVDGSKYWGKGCIEAEAMIKKDFGEDFQVATIGPAGENLVKYAIISHDFGRQAGRTGVGTVLGSKKVKAIAVRGTKSIPLAQPDKVYEKAKQMFDRCFSLPGFKEWTPYGTAGVTDWVNEVGSFPTKNFWTGYFEDYKKINGPSLRERILVTDKACFNCPIPCGKYSKTKTSKGEVYVEGPEYETIGMMGGNLLLGSIEEIAYVNYVADELGIDTISGGGVLAFAMECFEKGVITEREAGRKLLFGDLDSACYLLEKIAKREGIGDVLADGVRAAAAKLGKGSEKYAIHVKGLEISAYEPRYAPAMMLAYMTADVGAHHNRAWAITYDVQVGRDTLEGKAKRVIELQHIRPLFDTLGLCRLQWVEIGFELSHYAELFPLVTGINYMWDDLLNISERIWNLTRAYSIREIEGFGRDHDYPPPRFYEEKVPTGPAKGKGLTMDDLNRLLDDYYALRGWDSKGIPTGRKLRELGLDYVAEALGR
ncbi:MAG: aldehyde ferredoxin oxidoreductase family protein [Firmicutes bacterium]|jgi:aldehyde:ferredoxin oxidoreductase|nr:aldehyde ferredoxin oxidoreductase family protein [Bacillota bacterium]